MRVGVLALQGGFELHREPLLRLGHEYIPVRQSTDLEGVQGIVLPGGESTAQLRGLQNDSALRQAMDRLLQRGAPMLATCAGLVLAAEAVVPSPSSLSPSPSGPSSSGQTSLGWLPATVLRNGWGRQQESGEVIADDGCTRIVLIRGPRIIRTRAEVVARLNDEPIAIRAGNRWGATFHPELTDDLSFHRAVFGSKPVRRRTSNAKRGIAGPQW